MWGAGRGSIERSSKARAYYTVYSTGWCTASATQPQAYVASSTFGYSTDVISDFGMKKSHIHERNNGVHSYTKNTYL